MDLVNKVFNLTSKLNPAISKLAEHGRALALAEKEYKIMLRQEALKLRVEKSMPVTLINQIVYGVREVAEKRYLRDIEETMYNVAREYINTLKLEIRITESQLDKEWANAKRGT